MLRLVREKRTREGAKRGAGQSESESGRGARALRVEKKQIMWERARYRHLYSTRRHQRKIRESERRRAKKTSQPMVILS